MEKRNWNPGELMKVSGSYWQTCVLHAGVKLDLFSHLGSDGLETMQLAQKIGANARSLNVLLDALCAMDLLIKSDDATYHNTPETRNFLCRDSADYLGYIIMHHHYLVDSWYHLDQAVLSGNPVRLPATQSNPEKRTSFLMGMYNLAMLTAPKISEYLDFGNCYRLLDLGGGPGTFAIHFCVRNPQLKAVVFDLPESEKIARQTIEKFAMADRIEFVPGDFNMDTLPGRFDVIWISHVLHSEGPDACCNLLTKVVDALEPGGSIIIHDFILNETKDGPLFPALFNVNMLLGTENGRAYSQEQIVEMLNSVGVNQVYKPDFKGPNESGLLIAKLD